MSRNKQKENVKWRLKLTFLYYASYADKNNYRLLKSQNYKRFLIDSQSVTQHSGFAPFDIAFRKINTSAIKLNQFLDLLPAIAQLVYPNKNRKDAFSLYISNHMEKLFKQILQHSQFGADVLAIENLKIEKRSLEILNSSAVHKVYNKYIQSTSIHQKEPEQTFEQLYLFLSDYDISPKLIYKAMTYLAFYHQIQVTNTKTWSLTNMQELLICFAELYWRKIQNQNASQEEKVTRLLQHMQASPGFKKLTSKLLKQNAIALSFFKKQRFTTQLKDSREKDIAHSREKQPLPSSRKVGSKYNSTKKVDIGPIINLMEEQNMLVNDLKVIFQRLCSHGQVGNTQTLKSIKIKRYFKGLNLMNSLEQTWVDLTITDLCRTSPSGKREFPHFLQLLQVVAAKINVDEQGFLNYVVDHGQSWPEESHAFFSSKVSNRNKNNQLKAANILYQISKPLEKIFNHYRVGRKGMTFNQLSHFLFEFQIFPSFVNKSSLFAYFQDRSKATNEVNKLVGQISLDMSGFLDVLSDIAFEIGDNLSDEQKIIFLLERMQDSNGHRTLLGSEGTNLIGDLRSKYAHVYKKNLLKNSPKKQQNFDQLLDDYQK